MINVTNHLKEHNLTVAEIFDCDNTCCVLEDGRIAFYPWMNSQLFNKIDKEDYILCFTADYDGETNLEYIKTNTPATPCNVKIIVE